MRQYITIINFSDIEKQINEIQARAKSSKCALGQHIDIVGAEAIERFIKEYAPSAIVNTETIREPKTDGKTSAKILPYICIEIYGDSDIEAGHVLTERFYYQHYIIEYQNELYQLSKCRNESTGPMTLYAGPSWDFYKNYLPYNWDEQHPAPNKVGVLSDKKLNEWAEYLNERREAATAGFNESEGQKNAFRAALAALNPNEFDKCRIGETSGEIIKNGLQYTYRIEGNGYIHQEIKVHYSAGRGLDAFLNMAAGTFKPTGKIY